MILGRSSVRYLLHHPWQLVLSVLGVALGVAVVVSIDLAVQSSREAFRVSAETVAGRATHQIVGGTVGLPDSLLARIRVVAGVRRSAPVVSGYVSVEGVPGRPFQLLGIDPFSELPFRPFLGGGSGLDVGAFLVRDRSVVLSAGTAEELDVVPGDSLSLSIQGSTRPVTILGTVAAGGDLDRQGIRDLLFTDLSTAQELLGSLGRLERIDLILPRGTGGERALDRIRSLLPPSAAVEATGTRTASFLGMIDAFDLNLTALSLLALIFGMFLIYNTMTFSVIQRRELLGSLRALGVTRAGIFRLTLAEAAAIGFLGTSLGLGLGVLLGQGLVRLVTQTINDLYFVLTVEGLSVPPGVLAKGAAVGVGATLLASLPAAAEASLAPPRSTMTRSMIEERARALVPRAAVAGLVALFGGGLLLVVPGRSVPVSFAGLFCIVLGMALLTPAATVGLVRLARPLASGLFGILGGMAARGVTTALSRTAPAIASLVVAVAVTVGLGIMIGSFRSTLIGWLDSTLQADVYVSLPGRASNRPEGTLAPRQVRRLVSTEGVAGVSTYRAFSLASPYGAARFVALDLDPRGEDAFTLKEGGRERALRSFRSGEGVLVSESFAFRHGLDPGDSVRIPTEVGDRTFTVGGVFYDYGSDQGVVMLSRDAYDRLFSDRGVTSLGIFAAEGLSPETLRDRLQASLGGGQDLLVRSNRTLRRASLEVFDRTFAITAVLRLLAFVVAFIGVLGALMALQLDRTRELGVLRANGLTPGQVWKLTLAQTGLMGMIAGLLSIPAGLVLAAVMIFVVNRRSFGWTLEMQIGTDVMLQALGLALGGALLAGLYPAWRMSRTPPAEALRGGGEAT